MCGPTNRESIMRVILDYDGDCNDWFDSLDDYTDGENSQASNLEQTYATK